MTADVVCLPVEASAMGGSPVQENPAGCVRITEYDQSQQYPCTPTVCGQNRSE